MSVRRDAAYQPIPTVDLLASLYQSKIESLRAPQFQYRESGVLPSPETMGFFAKSER